MFGMLLWVVIVEFKIDKNGDRKNVNCFKLIFCYYLCMIKEMVDS